MRGHCDCPIGPFWHLVFCRGLFWNVRRTYPNILRVKRFIHTVRTFHNRGKLQIGTSRRQIYLSPRSSYFSVINSYFSVINIYVGEYITFHRLKGSRIWWFSTSSPIKMNLSENKLTCHRLIHLICEKNQHARIKLSRIWCFSVIKLCLSTNIWYNSGTILDSHR